MTPYDWVREIDPALKKLDQIPLTGSPPFPWSHFSDQLSKTFDRSIRFEPGEIRWRTKEQLYEGLGDTLSPLVFAIPSLNGNVSWVMPEQEMSALESMLLSKDPHPLTFHDRSLSESFYHFIALESLFHFSQLDFDKTLSPVLTSQKTLPDEHSLTLDVSMVIENRTLWGRLIVSPALQQAWVEHWIQKGMLSLNQQLPQQAELLVHIECGNTQLTLEEWNNVRLGDFILLDHCSIDPADPNGRVMLTINGKPIFRAKLKEGHVKILELPTYHEAETPMAKNENNPSENEADSNEIEEEDLFGEEEEAGTVAAGENGETEEVEEDLFDEEPATPTARKEPAAVPSTASAAAKAEQHITPSEIPVSLIVEVGRINMTMEKLLALEPGNLLELDVHPENGINLTINGKIVAKGELIRIGESLGVRLLELGTMHHKAT